MKNLDNYKLNEKNVLLRADLNVPVVNGIITEKSRIQSLKKTIFRLKINNNKIFLISHFGRPKGKFNKEYSLNFICSTLQEELSTKKIYFLDNFNNQNIQNMIKKMDNGDICLFENIRFFSEEENNDYNFAKSICKNFDVYVNDAFSASHRNHASIISMPKFLPSLAVFSLLNEISNIDNFIKNLKKPNLGIIGGSKISTKINLIYNLLKLFDNIFIGGAMANTFLYAKNIEIGKSLCEKNLSKIAISILEDAKKFNCKIILPIDVVCADSIDDKLNIKQCNLDEIVDSQMIFDIGNKTTQLISNYILRSNMILWNGPLGVFEYKPFDKSSIDIANTIKDNASLLNFTALAGGGDTISAIKNAKAESGFSYISNAGGAFLEWLEGNESPGVKALKNNKIN